MARPIELRGLGSPRPVRAWGWDMDACKRILLVKNDKLKITCGFVESMEKLSRNVGRYFESSNFFAASVNTLAS